VLARGSGAQLAGDFFVLSSAGFSGAGVAPWSGVAGGGVVLSDGAEGAAVGGGASVAGGFDSSLSFFLPHAPKNKAIPIIAAATPASLVLIIFYSSPINFFCWSIAIVDAATRF
jgi:hypothetical protein